MHLLIHKVQTAAPLAAVLFSITLDGTLRLTGLILSITYTCIKLLQEYKAYKQKKNEH